MKYIDAEKLIAEIDSILSACTKQTHTGVYNTCHRIKGIIASLQQEQPESGCSEKPNNLQEQPEVDLDNLTIMKEIKKCGCNPNEFDIARHFAEWGANHLNTRKEE